MDGYIVQMDMGDVVELVKLLRSISSNVNQIARRCNETRNLYAETWRTCGGAMPSCGRSFTPC